MYSRELAHELPDHSLSFPPLSLWVCWDYRYTLLHQGFYICPRVSGHQTHVASALNHGPFFQALSHLGEVLIGSLMVWNSPWKSCWPTSEPQGPARLHPPRPGIASVCHHILALLCAFLGIKLRTFCSCGKHLTRRPVSLASWVRLFSFLPQV